MKEFCKCGHSKKSHVMSGDDTSCCCVWQVSEEREAKEDMGSLLRFCPCRKYEQQLNSTETKNG